MNSGTHCSLKLIIAHGFCRPVIELAGIGSPGNKTYACISGSIEIDRELWKKGTIKAAFDFLFDHTENPAQPMYWKGKLLKTIENQ
jgi:hypothetical protein